MIGLWSEDNGLNHPGPVYLFQTFIMWIFIYMQTQLLYFYMYLSLEWSLKIICCQTSQCFPEWIGRIFWHPQR